MKIKSAGKPGITLGNRRRLYAMQGNLPFRAFCLLCAAALLLLRVPLAGQAAARLPDQLLQAGHTSLIYAVAFSPDQQWLASGGEDRNIILWNLTSGQETRKLKGHAAPLRQLAFSPDGKRLLSADSRGAVKAWDFQAGDVVYSAALRGPVPCLAYSPDGKFWAACADSAREGVTSRILIHDAATGKMLRALSPGWYVNTALTITPEGLLIASGSSGDDDDSEGLIRVWNLASGDLLKSYPVLAGAFSADGHWMARLDISPQFQVVLSDLATGQKKQTIAGRNLGAFALSPRGETLAVVDSAVSALKLWSVATGKEIATLPGDQSLGLAAVAFSPDGKLLAAAAYSGYSIKTWEVSTARERQTLYGQPSVQGVAVSPDGRWLAMGLQEGLSLWDVPAGKRTAMLCRGPVNVVAFSPDGRWLAANPGGQFPGKTLKVWSTKSWRLAADFTSPNGGPVFWIAFAPNGTPLTKVGLFTQAWQFTADGETLTVWGGPSPLAISPNGRLLVTKAGPSGTLEIWDTHAAQKIQSLPAHKLSVTSLAFSSDGQRLLTAGQETPISRPYAAVSDPTAEFSVKLWDVATWREKSLATTTRVGAPIAAFSPDGHRLAFEESWDVIALFDIDQGAATGTLTASAPRSGNRTFSTGNLGFGPDGTWVYQGAQNGVRVWKLKPPGK